MSQHDGAWRRRGDEPQGGPDDTREIRFDQPYGQQRGGPHDARYDEQDHGAHDDRYDRHQDDGALRR